jgi:hypothetical protein
MAVSTDKISSDREPRSSRHNRPAAGLLLHVGAGAVLVLVMVFVALYLLTL